MRCTVRTAAKDVSTALGTTKESRASEWPSRTFELKSVVALCVLPSAHLQHFFAARRAAGSSWTLAAPYRTALKDIPREKQTQRLYEGCNSAAIACIKHVAAVRSLIGSLKATRVSRAFP